MIFEDWSKDCDCLDGIYCRGDRCTYECDEDNCPRYDEFTADLEAHEYSVHLEHRMEQKMEKRD